MICLRTSSVGSSSPSWLSSTSYSMPSRRADSIGFGAAALGQRAAALALVPGIAVRHRDELHLVPHLGELRRGAAGADVAVVRVRAEHDDTERVRLRQRARRNEKRNSSGFSYVSEFPFPGRLLLLVDSASGRECANSVLMADRSPMFSTLPVSMFLEERLERFLVMSRASVEMVSSFFGPLTCTSLPARGQQHALGAGELLADLAESGRRIWLASKLTWMPLGNLEGQARGDRGSPWRCAPWCRPCPPR